MPVVSFDKTVADPGTPEVLKAASFRCDWVTIQAKATNTKSVTITDLDGAGGYTIADRKSVV